MGFPTTVTETTAKTTVSEKRDKEKTLYGIFIKYFEKPQKGQQ